LQVDLWHVRPENEVRRVVPRSIQEVDVKITLVAKDPGSAPDGSPTLYRTDRDSWVVQGWVVSDPEVLAAMSIPRGEACVEIPDRLVPFFDQAR
jgi:hypothetical protein